MPWQFQCRGCETREQGMGNVDPKAKGMKVYLRRAWTVTRAELQRLG